MNAIIISAGSGKRISKDDKDIPKSMVKVNGQPILKYQLSILKYKFSNLKSKSKLSNINFKIPA